MWYVCQIGAREHYAVARALNRKNQLDTLITDVWVNRPLPIFYQSSRGNKLASRHHKELPPAKIYADNFSFIKFEAKSKLLGIRGMQANMHRNDYFQQKALSYLRKKNKIHAKKILFSYSYAASQLFRFAKDRGWKTILCQIDPGPEEERIVIEEHKRYPHLASKWKPAPNEYWKIWREDLDLADIIIVNSKWSQNCLLKEGISKKKIRLIPLVYELSHENKKNYKNSTHKKKDIFNVLFLGQINLRKGIGRLLEAMELLEEEPIKLTLIGSSEINPESFNNKKNIKWYGSVPRNEVHKYYKLADIFILPTLSDGFAITQLEALSNGLPVISSKHCGEAVCDGINGWILENCEPQTIAKVILKARETELKSIENNNAFSIDALGDALLDLENYLLR